jgi:hypothetical protein
MAMWLLLIVAALDYNCFPKCSSQYSLRRSRNLLSFEVRKQIGGGYAHQGLERIAFTIPASIIDFMRRGVSQCCCLLPSRGFVVLVCVRQNCPKLTCVRDAAFGRTQNAVVSDSHDTTASFMPAHFALL